MIPVVKQDRNLRDVHGLAAKVVQIVDLCQADLSQNEKENGIDSAECVSEANP